MNLTHRQRFDLQITPQKTFAPLSHGCPSMIMVTDYSVFKHLPGEENRIKEFKSELGKTKNYKFKSISHIQI